MENKPNNESEWTFNWAITDFLSCFLHKLLTYSCQDFLKSDYKKIILKTITLSVAIIVI